MPSPIAQSVGALIRGTLCPGFDSHHCFKKYVGNRLHSEINLRIQQVNKRSR